MSIADRACIRVVVGRGGLLRRRWTGIEPAAVGAPQPTALKAAESTRYSDTSAWECNDGQKRPASRRRGRQLDHQARHATIAVEVLWR